MGATSSTTARPAAPGIVDLDSSMARDPGLAGAKAAALARARSEGIRVLPGFAITTLGARAYAGESRPEQDVAALEDAWRQLSADGTRSLVVRSSSTIEDGDAQSMAGLFSSVLDVRGWSQFLEAVQTVVGSGGESPMAVLVQPFIEPTWGGVLFGADPVTGHTDRLLVAAVPGGPDRLVSGQVDGVHLTLTPRGRLREASPDTPPQLRGRRPRRSLAALAKRAAVTFGGPQDIEWAMLVDGAMVLLQSRPITALGEEARATGPVFGPGPVAETFGTPLRPLEEELWVVPLRDGLREALAFTGSTPSRRLRDSPLVVTVGGRVAADLELLGPTPRRRGVLARLDPRPPMRRLRAAWRVGRLRAALPALADDLVTDVDADLRSLPDLTALTATDLVRLLRRSRHTLVALHGHEVLAGMLLDDDDAQVTAASAALRILAQERAGENAATDGPVDDEELIARHPVLLALTSPSIGAIPRLPPPPSSPPVLPPPTGGEVAVRESLRLRIRWVQELTGRAALDLGHRLVRRGMLAAPTGVVHLGLDDLETLVMGGRAAHAERADVADAGERSCAGPPLPASFRLTADGVVVAVGRSGEARGAGGGRGVGPVHIGTDVAPESGDVLVVRTLDPSLAPLLPGLGGLVAETGSVLSHLAILAREYGVPTVVAFAGAVGRFADGAWVTVDGGSGEVTALEDYEWGAA
jgi:rifampicin phosphotransferase